MNPRRTSTWLWLAVVFTAIGLLFCGRYYFDDLARGLQGTLGMRLFEEMTGAYCAFALLPLLFWAVAAAPLRSGALRVLGYNVSIFVAYSFCHTTLMALSRAMLSPLFGMGPYHYGDMHFRYFMEASGDSVYYAMMVCALYFLDHLRRTRQNEVRAAELQAQLAQATLQNLRLQLHPHFLFNTLNAISSVMYEDVSRADAMLSKLSDFLRRALAHDGVATVPLAEELDAERMYVELMALRFERPLDFRVDVEGSALDTRVPFLLLQPLLENAIKHGTREARDLAISIAARRNATNVAIEVCDDGRGYVAGGSHGIGLRNVRDRLHHTFGAGAAFEIAARAEGGTCVRLSIPTGTQS